MWVRALIGGLVALAAVALAGCGGSSGAATASADVTDIATFDDVRSQFAAADGAPRLVLLLAPT